MTRKNENDERGKNLNGRPKKDLRRYPPLVLPENTDESPDIASPNPKSKVPGQVTHQ